MSGREIYKTQEYSFCLSAGDEQDIHQTPWAACYCRYYKSYVETHESASDAIAYLYNLEEWGDGSSVAILNVVTGGGR